MKKIIALLLILCPLFNYAQSDNLVYEFGFGTSLCETDYYNHENDSLSNTQTDSYNFYLNIESPLKYGSIYFGSGLIIDNDEKYIKLYNIPVRVGLRLYPIPRTIYMYGYGSIYWGDKISGSDIFGYDKRYGVGVGYGFGIGIRLFDAVSLSGGYNYQQYGLNYENTKLKKDIYALEFKFSILLKYD